MMVDYMMVEYMMVDYMMVEYMMVDYMMVEYMMVEYMPIICLVLAAVHARSDSSFISLRFSFDNARVNKSRSSAGGTPLSLARYRDQITGRTWDVKALDSSWDSSVPTGERHILPRLIRS
jgi:hypothetical protein